MSIERTYCCDGPECEAHIRTATPPPYLPAGYLALKEGGPTPGPTHHFCSWDCVLKYAAEFPPVETIPLAGGD